MNKKHFKHIFSARKILESIKTKFKITTLILDQKHNILIKEKVCTAFSRKDTSKYHKATGGKNAAQVTVSTPAAVFI